MYSNKGPPAFPQILPINVWPPRVWDMLPSLLWILPPTHAAYVFLMEKAKLEEGQPCGAPLGLHIQSINGLGWMEAVQGPAQTKRPPSAGLAWAPLPLLPAARPAPSAQRPDGLSVQAPGEAHGHGARGACRGRALRLGWGDCVQPAGRKPWL